MRNLVLASVLAVLVVGAWSVGQASDVDETIVTVAVSSADHEIEEGYFALGDMATVVARPGSDLHRFLTRQRGKKVKIILTEVDARELSRLQR